MFIIDPGHTSGGADPGAVGASGTREGDITLILARKLQILLASRGLAASLTHAGQGIQPGSEPNTELNARTRFIQSVNPAASISIHCNAAGDRSAHGMEVFYYPGSSSGETLAYSVYAELLAAGMPYGITGRGVKTANYAMTRELAEINKPGILIELAFISNPAEEKTLNNASYQDQAAAAIVKGVLKFMGISPQPSEWELKVKAAAEWVKAAGISDGMRTGAYLTRGEFFVILKALADKGILNHN